MADVSKRRNNERERSVRGPTTTTGNKQQVMHQDAAQSEDRLLQNIEITFPLQGCAMYWDLCGVRQSSTFKRDFNAISFSKSPVFDNGLGEQQSGRLVPGNGCGEQGSGCEAVIHLGVKQAAPSLSWASGRERLQWRFDVALEWTCAVCAACDGVEL
ncbi:uncharacterized protein LOC119597825 isoform X2 [Penaeus monodon]|uniref:uncharacterized protein LOC119597825 isoform X2 n=1 Tax=Penaeus monodon TaxID=6687 RepID=UPI0018A76358|nr:uncharacterized protein LOC119597825 isoform X2 [Penaeus monodon]